MAKKKQKIHGNAEEKASACFPIVGIGASAGGLEALEKFFTHLPGNSPKITFVIIQHLSPKHKSIMASLLSKYTQMKVLEIADGMAVEPGRIYLNPPNKNVTIFKGVLQLLEPHKKDGINLPIDFFFRSMAEDMGEKTICIVLSGTAADGTQGIKAVKGAGGMVMVQEPGSAKYDGMPRSAINTGLVDFILPVEQIPPELGRYIKHPYIEGTHSLHLSESQSKNCIMKVFGHIRSATGHDFSNYKQNTIRRRIERRMAVHQIDTLSQYVLYLQKTPVEVETLFKDLLIGVTNFFRDSEAFDIIEKKVIPELLASRPADSTLRVWIVGCYTGEEAYSMAILFSEAMERLNKHYNIQLFASDIDSDAIDAARAAVYPDSIAADVSPERLSRYFVKENNIYKVKKQIREMVVFAVHNIIKDPPFSKIDLVSCRNLLIYMDAVLQRKILPLFHYTLNTHGFLFLGTAESIGDFADIFLPVNSKWKVFKHKKNHGVHDLGHLSAPSYDNRIMPREDNEKKALSAVDISHAAERVILDNYSLPGVLIDEKLNIVQFLGDTDPFLSTPRGEATFEIMKMVREGLRYKLSSAITDASRQKKTITCDGLRINNNSQFRVVDIVVRPLMEKTFTQGYMLVLFDDKTSNGNKTVPGGNIENKPEIDPCILRLEQELQATKEYLQTSIEELETSNEELKSTNEELQSVNEELQSTNEELETSKEELQSTNEELVTVNTELQKKVDELSEANNDINNLLASTEIGTVFLDLNLCIKRFTPAITDIFNLIQSDAGRPISDITSNIQCENLFEKAEKVLRTLERYDAEVKSSKGAWYHMRIVPYRTNENVIDGVVITFVNVSKAKEIEFQLREKDAKVSYAQRFAKVGYWDWDLEINKVTWSDQMYHICGLDEKSSQLARDTLEKLVYPEDKHLLSEETIKKTVKIEGGYQADFRIIRQNTGEIKYIRSWGETIFDSQKNPIHIKGIVQDITEFKEMEAALIDAREKWRSLSECTPDTIMMLAPDCIIQFISRPLPGYTIEQLTQTTLYSYLPEKSRIKMKECLENVLKTGETGEFRVNLNRAGDGGARYFEGNAGPLRRDGAVTGISIIGRVRNNDKQ